MTTTPQVRILIDVDGVLNACALKPVPEVWGDWQEQTVNRMPITWSPTLAASLAELAATDGVELVWLTTWEHDANAFISPLLGWPEHRVLEDPDRWCGRGPLSWWKFRKAAETFAADGVPFVWIDDDLKHDPESLAWLRTLNGAGLGVSPNDLFGITPEELSEIRGFVLSHLAPESDVQSMTTSTTPATATDPMGEIARVVASVPKTASFQFIFNGFSFFVLTSGEFVAVAK